MMSRITVFLVICLTLYTSNIECARILGVYPTPSISHQVVFRALSIELAKRGHEMVTITPDPAFRNKTPPENLTEIDIGQAYGLLQELVLDKKMAPMSERGVISDFVSIIKVETINPLVQFGLDMFTFPEVKSLIADKSQKFDLVIVEALSYSGLIFSKLYNAPAILFSSFHGTPDNFLTVGAVSRHPTFYPHVLRSRFRGVSIFEKLQELKDEWDLYQFEIRSEQTENDFLKSEFGVDAPTVHELKTDFVELLFANVHPIFGYNRPVPPGVVHLGAIHLQPTKPLPEELKAYLDNSSRGVIYVSFGTNVRPTMMDQELLDAILDAFEALPFNIMWKIDGENLKRTPKNVRVQKWFPQRDLLEHPNIKLFITQGGLQSTDEAIDAGLPMVGVPFIGDQWFNVNKYVELGIGIMVDARTLTADRLVNAAYKVISDESFRKNIAKLRSVMRDQPEKPIDRAVWWTEYVLRHGRSKSLLPPSALMSWSEYLMADVLGALALVATVAATLVAIVLYYVVCFVSVVNKKIKVKQA